jgi:hypothetical protein
MSRVPGAETRPGVDGIQVRFSESETPCLAATMRPRPTVGN